MRFLAIGDIHGCANALSTLLSYITLRKNDIIITVGDYVDRGPNSYGVIEQLIQLSQNHQLISLRGNHEIMMLRARESSAHHEDWLSNGGNATLRSYSPLGDKGKITDVLDEHWSFLERCCPYYQTEKYFVVHANAYPDLPLEEQPDYMLYWERINDAAPHMSGKKMICGHTPQKNGLPRDMEHAICIDTDVCSRNGWLTALDLVSCKYWQANNDGQVRSDFL
ncbi:metallophosphoesterase family protein [Candidatus Uabimicrobium sp. HlEnr_7]|uniref:metallophosphoesterase family protein n=1 Tax=Candidatus Uabimicrobium helgolandensis TaxID=3095367 RepID=UPI0035582883